MNTKVDFEKLFKERLRLYGVEDYKRRVDSSCETEWTRLEPEELPRLLSTTYCAQPYWAHTHELLCIAAKQYLETV
jgi:hypothetical protein